MYTVFTEDGQPKINRIGMVVFERTLALAKAQMVPGDSVTRWSSSGYAVKQWTMSTRGTLVAS